MTPPNHPDDFRKALTATTKALAQDPEFTVQYTANQPSRSGHNIRIPQIPRSLPPEYVTNARGWCDSFALNKRYHEEALHKKNLPTSAEALDIFNALEQVRVETYGSRHLDGVRQNLKAVNLERIKNDPICMAKQAKEVPLATALALMLHERLTGQDVPDIARPGLDLVRDSLEKKIGSNFNQLEKQLDNQLKFADVMRKIITGLDLPIDTGHQDDSEGGEDLQDDQKEQTEDQDQSDSDDGLDDSGTDTGQISGSAEQQAEEDISKDEEFSPAQDDMMDGDASGEDETSHRHNYNTQHKEEDDYKVFTIKYDEVVTVKDLCHEEELTRLRTYLDQHMQHLHSAVTKLANRLQRLLMAQKNRSWNFDQEEGLLDAARLTRIITNPYSALSYKVEQEFDFKDTVVTILIDNSGSMRGRPIAIAAICTDILARTLERCGVKVEILGFTTKNWKGGQSRSEWLEAGRPAHPGRLNDLRHIIYKKADEPWRRARRSLGLMMREGLLKENIDGEALLWAHGRLITRPEERQILMVISDGAPVDDSTLSVNNGIYLEMHLRNVIALIEAESPVELIAIGIGHDVTRYYKRAVTIMDAEQLGGAMTDQLAQLFDKRQNQHVTKRPY